MVAVTVDIPNGNEQFYEKIIARVFPQDKIPDGWQFHVAGPVPDGWRIVNVVPSQEEFEAFAGDQLRPALQELEGGVTPVLTFFPVHKLIQGTQS
jgi:hypothetical protein